MSKIQTIYEPSGKAREYSPLALNLYKGCDHGCNYCYVPDMKHAWNADYDHGQVEPRPGIIEALRKDARRFRGTDKPVLMSFTGDPYCRADVKHQLTRKALEILLENRIPVSILTKGGTRVLRDLDIIEKFGRHIQVGATLTFHDYHLERIYEPGASDYMDRLRMLYKLHGQGIRTWVSFEPVCIPKQSLALMEFAAPVIDFYKVGKLNHGDYGFLPVDWREFTKQAVDMLRAEKKPFYIKKSLQAHCLHGLLRPEETDPDRFCAPAWPKENIVDGGGQ